MARVVDPVAVGVRFHGLYTLLLNRYYIDELYARAIDVLAIAPGARLAVFDRRALDGLVNGVADLTLRAGSRLRTVQTGRIPQYGLVMLAGVAVIALALLLAPR